MNAIELHSVSKTFPGKLALNEVSFSVSEDSIHGFLGPNGAGKTTAMNIICGLLPPSSGSVKLLNGEKSSIGFLPEQIPLYEDMRVRPYLEFVFGIFNGKNNKQIERTINRCGLESVAKQYIRTLSRGFKQRLGIAQAIVCDPKIVVLDEPTIGLDPNSIIEIRNLIRELSADHTILLSTHILAEAELLCDELTLINEGRVLASGKIDDVKSLISDNERIQVRAKSWNNIELSELEEKFAIKNLKLKDDTLYLESAMNQKKKSDFLAYLLIENIEVFEFKGDKVQLEELFSNLVQKGGSFVH